MSDTRRSGLSLNLKFFLFTAIIIVLLIAGTLWFSSRKATVLANQTIRDGLKETLSAFDSFQRDRYTKLKMTNSLIAQDSYIQSYVAEADSASILDLARQKQADLKSDFIIIADPEGTILARTDRPSASGKSVADVPLIQQASEGEEAAGLWQEDQNLYNAVALPVVTGDMLTATLAVGYAINDSVAAEMKNLTHSETAFFLIPSKGDASLIATTISGNQDDLLTAFRANVSRKEPFEFQLGPEKYIGVIRELKNPNGQVLGAFSAFRSLDRELFAFHQFQKSILYVGLGITGFAFLISFLGARQITGPLRKLTDAVNEVKEGNYNVPIDVKSGDEVGILAESFRKLLGELKEKEQLVEYLSHQPTLSSVTGAATVVQQPQFTTDGTSVHQTTHMRSITVGTVIGNRYEVQSVLGAGGMGVVLKAQDRQLDEPVALKMLKAEVFAQDPAALERFKQELKLARRITHRNIVRTYDYAELDNYHAISMEYVKGITLKQLIRQRGMLPVKIGLQVGKQICSALDAAHEKGVVHRDIKPQNILLESTGDVKVMDFGIARVLDMKGMTSTGTIMGTPDYMSPEQAQGLDIDYRTDIYSTGIVLYEIFTGKLPFNADSALTVLNKHIREAPPNPSTLNPQIPSELEKIMLKCMAKSPDQRYRSIAEVHTALEEVSLLLNDALEKTA